MGRLLAEYDPGWVELYEGLAERISLALTGLIEGIQHVGSTAIPGMIAKPIIDIDVVIPNYDYFEAVSLRLADLGYENEGNLGIPDRIAFGGLDPTAPYCNPERQWITHHLYVCPSFSQELYRDLAFRDFLKSNEDARLRYGRIKLQIEAETGGDRKAYAIMKETKARPFVESILAKAHK
jgi:GrpB-like predicted nucleotidyltransferase (UPF0157 family)